MKTSVITLTQNRPVYLDEALRSIEAQTDRRWEHIVWDNGSTDPKVKDVLRIAKRRNPDKLHFGLHPQERVDSIGYFWNKLLKLTSGPYITILDDDNRKKPDFLAKMLAPMERNPEIEAVTCGWSVIDGDGRPTGEDRHLNLQTTLMKLWADNTIDSNAVVFRRSVLTKIGLFDPTLSTNEDWHFMIRLIRQCRVVHLHDCLLEYREHSGARSKQALELGAHANWKKIRKELFTPEEERAAIAASGA